jgi:membrane associated rhomboid family serine protease
MVKIGSVPAVTRTALVLLIVLSTVVATLRYTYYASLVTQRDKEIAANTPTPEDVSQGKNFPLDQALQQDLPRPTDLYVPFLTLVPGETHIFYPWVLITTSFVEQHIVAFIFAFMALLYGGRYCETVWGPREMTTFLLIQTTIPNFASLVLYGIWYMLFDNIDPMTGLERPRVTICGTAAVMSGFLVAFKQLLPEHTVVLFKGRMRFRVKTLLILYVAASMFWGILGNELQAVLAWTGFLTSWTYLRFYRTAYVDPVLPFHRGVGQRQLVFEHSNPSGIRVRGDASDAFAFHNFFPDPFRFIAAKVSVWVFPLFVATRLCTPFTESEVEAANGRAAARVSSATSYNVGLSPLDRQPRHLNARLEAERRRSLALRALDTELPSTPSVPARPSAAVLPLPKAGKD